MVQHIYNVVSLKQFVQREKGTDHDWVRQVSLIPA